MKTVKRYSLFLGCQIPLRITSVEIAARKLFQKLDVELVDLEGYSCCPDPVVSRTLDRKMWLTLSARNLSLAEEIGLDLMTLCVGCYLTLSEASAILKHETGTKKEIDETLSIFKRKYAGKIKVKHFVEVLFEDLGIGKIKEEVERPLKLRAALHYGCHLFRSEEGEDIWRKPQMMKELVRATGAEVIDYGVERLCCGFPVMHADEEFSLKSRLLPKLREIDRAKADCVVVVCPACTLQFENGQALLRRYGFRYDLPCIYLSELLALAFGIPSAELSLDFHRSPIPQLVQRLG